MADNEYSTDNYNSTGAVTKNPEILKFIPDYLKSKQMHSYGVKKYLS